MDHFSMSAIVLAGGRSSRMGTPKALLPFGGEPLITHIVRALQPRFGDVIVVAAEGQDLPPLPARVVRDDVAFQGPVGGLVYGLRALERDWAFATSCDSAFLSEALVGHLQSHCGADREVVVTHWDGRFQPLFAMYRRTVLPVLEAQLAAGELRPVSLFDKVRTQVVREEEIRRFDRDGSSFFNMNTPEDYAEALRRWERTRRPARSAGEVSCTVELFGVAQLLAGADKIPLALPAGATLAHVFSALAEQVPPLAGRVVVADGAALAEGYACNLNGLDFVRSGSTRIRSGDTIVIVSADAGG